MTSYSETLQAELIRDEGYRDRPYKDTTGHLTIGVGHNFDAGGLCRAAILAQLDEDIRVAEVGLDRILPGWQSHPEAVRRVLVNLSFNLGGRLAQFRHFLAAIASKDYRLAADHLLDSHPWVDQVGARATRLAKTLRDVV